MRHAGIRKAAVAVVVLMLAVLAWTAPDPERGVAADTPARPPKKTGTAAKGDKGKAKKKPAGKGAKEPETSEEPVLHLTFDADSLCREGDVVRALDASGNGNHATLRGAEPDVGRFGGAMSFNGKDAFLEGSDAALPKAGEPSTISLWFNARQNQFSGLFAYGKKQASAARGIACNPGTFVCYFRWKDGAADWKLQLPLNEWHHLAVTYDGRQSTLYVDGVEKGSSPQEVDTAHETYIVGRNLSTQNFFDGLIDEVAVYNRPLTAEEIKTLFTREPSPSTEKTDLSTVKACAKPAP